MRPATQYILGCLGATVIGVLSAVIVFSIGLFLHVRTGTRLYMVFAVAIVVGAVVTLAGSMRAARALVDHFVARYRHATARCHVCGYDLRATPQKGGALFKRCPECGAARSARTAA